MNLELMMSAWMFVCALIGTIYGALHFLTKKSALYLQMIACGVGCQMFARLFDVIYIALNGELHREFNIGMLGIVGSFLFILSANYGQMDSLVDDGSAALRPTRRKALLAPAALLALYAGFCCAERTMALRLAVGLITAFLLPAAYYSFKHFIIYAVEGGVIRCIRGYNLLALAYAVLVLLEFIFGYLSLAAPYALACIGVGAVTLAMMPTLQRGWARGRQ